MKRWPAISTRLAGQHLAAAYRAICSQGVQASAVAPKLVGPARQFGVSSLCWAYVAQCSN